MAPTHHAIDYIAFTALDLPAVKAFSTAAFDWRLNDYAPGYAGIVAPGGTGEISGFNATGDGRAGGNPLVLLYSDDLDATVEAVRGNDRHRALRVSRGAAIPLHRPQRQRVGGVAGSRIALNRRGVRPVTK